jgi:mannose-6-phosphate isomerase
MKPLEFQPILKRIRWGGIRLGTLLNKPIGEGTDYAESWEIADHGDDQSLVVQGDYKAWPLERLVAEQGTELFGIHAPRKQFPLLVKFLDATDRLSLQVHPNDEQAKTIDAHENGKTEAWVIVDAAPGSCLYAGLKSGIDHKLLAESLAQGTVEECLHRFHVSQGDCVYIPAGTVHAISEGILLAEIQQSSDLTFRLCDWGRVGSDGNPRPLHVEQALNCIDFDRGPVDPLVPNIISRGRHTVEELVRCEFFVIRRHTTEEPFTIATDNRFHILTLLGGCAELVCGDDRREFAMGRTILLPASAADARLMPTGEIILLETFLP